ncbi:MAG: acyl carrier protein [Bacteroidales bacterium]|nr:acyl carrier protein [Bacteroidales bacterium]
MSDIKNKVKEIVVNQLGVDEAEVTDAASFTNDLGADMLDSVELLMQIELAFNLSIPDDVWERLATVGEVVDYIERQLAPEVRDEGFL